VPLFLRCGAWSGRPGTEDGWLVSGEGLARPPVWDRVSGGGTCPETNPPGPQRKPARAGWESMRSAAARAAALVWRAAGIPHVAQPCRRPVSARGFTPGLTRRSRLKPT